MIAKWIVVAWIAFGALLTIGMIGQPRKPITPGAAAVGTVLSAALLVTIIVFWR